MNLDKETPEPLVAPVDHEHANDSHELWSRLADFAKRGMEAPETLTLYEIRQVSFALSLLMPLSEKNSVKSWLAGDL